MLPVILIYNPYLSALFSYVFIIFPNFLARKKCDACKITDLLLENLSAAVFVKFHDHRVTNLGL